MELAAFLLPCVGKSYRLLSRPLVGSFTLGVSYKILGVERGFLVAKDDKGVDVLVSFSRFDMRSEQ